VAEAVDSPVVVQDQIFSHAYTSIWFDHFNAEKPRRQHANLVWLGKREPSGAVSAHYKGKMYSKFI
jgi:hypothetical protein